MDTAKIITKLRFKDSKFKGCSMYKVISEDYILGDFYVGYNVGYNVE